jgi:hypothetical protein
MANITPNDIIALDHDGKTVKFPSDPKATLFKIIVKTNVGQKLGDFKGISVHKAERPKIVAKSLDAYNGIKTLIVTEELARFAEQIRWVLGDDVQILSYKASENIFLEY